MEYEHNYASKGVAGAGLGLGIAGTALGLLNGNGLGGLFGGWGANAATCHENMPVNRYEAQQQARISELETEVKLRDSNIYTDSKILDLYTYVNGKFTSIEKELCDQKVYNATNTATIGCIANQVNQLMALTKLVIPNTSICPGWGNVTVTPAAAATA
jgi:hypothetical protein